MGRRLTSLLLLLALLFGGSGLPAIAHAHDGATLHALELLDSHAPSKQTDDPSTSPGHHHHGVSDAAVAATGQTALLPTIRQRPSPKLMRPMISVNREPPTEPPSA